jgi:hypothetical protein
MDVSIKWACATMASWCGVGADHQGNGDKDSPNRVYDEDGSVIETHEQAGEFKEW